jgi:glucose-1-phosphate thymidylyltransferase
MREILIVTTQRDLPLFRELLGDGKQLGVHLQYAVQDEPRGIADCFRVGAGFIGSDSVTVILGDNIFIGSADLEQQIRSFDSASQGCLAFSSPVQNPSHYGVVAFSENGEILSLEEKPPHPRSNLAVCGLYVCDNEALKIARTVTPSVRDELEIIEVLRAYLRTARLQVRALPNKALWFDAGTPDSLLDASQAIRAAQSETQPWAGCIEEAAYRAGLIRADELAELAIPAKRTAYGRHMLRVAQHGLDRLSEH